MVPPSFTIKLPSPSGFGRKGREPAVQSPNLCTHFVTSQASVYGALYRRPSDWLPLFILVLPVKTSVDVPPIGFPPYMATYIAPELVLHQQSRCSYGGLYSVKPTRGIFGWRSKSRTWRGWLMGPASPPGLIPPLGDGHRTEC